ncbi:MAG: tetratricopeptide repeat protein [Shimia sp.]
MVWKPLQIVCAVAAFLAGPLAADQLDPLYDRLQRVGPDDAKPIAEKIWQEWEKSGSPTADLLLDRGIQAMEAEDWPLAIEHFTALTDHAPGFAHGWHARGTAFFRRGLYGPAIDDLRRAIALEPRHFAAISGLAQIMEEVGEERAALDLYRRVESIHPHRENLSRKIEQLEQMVGGATL